MLEWTQEELAEKADVALNTIRYFENGERTPHDANRQRICKALEAGGIELIDRNGGGPGARLKR